MKKLNILFLSSWYPSRISPTNGNFVKRHAEAIALLHEVTVVYPIGDVNKIKNDYEIEQKTEKGVRNIIVYFKKHPVFLFNIYRKLLALKKGMSFVKKIDIIHANILYPVGILALFVKIKYSKPLIFTEHWTGYFHPKKSNLNFLKILFLKFLAHKTSYIAPVSSLLQEAMLKMGLKTNYKVIGNAVDTNLFYPKERNNLVFKILHVSNLKNTHKNIEGLLSVIHKLSKKRTDFIISIIGGKDLQPVKKQINKIGIPHQLIDLQGVKTPQEIARSMQDADLYISFSNYETFGVVLIEALATQTPVISTNTGILTEYETEDFCKIIPINDREQLLNEIENYMDNKYTFDKNKMRAFAVKNFSNESIAEQYSHLYYKIIKDE